MIYLPFFASIKSNDLILKVNKAEMKIGKLFFTFFIIFVFSNIGKAQKLDTNLILANARIKFLSFAENYVYRDKDLCKIGNCNGNFRFLRTKGFRGMLFFELLLDSIKSTNEECFAAYFYSYHGTAIFAYDIPSNSIYFINNENADEWRRFLSIFRGRINQFDIKNKNSFMNDVFIESADMRTLFREINHLSKKRRKFSFKKNYSKVSQISWRQ